MRFKNPAFFFFLIPLILLLARAWWDLHKKRISPRVIIPNGKLWGAASAKLFISYRFWHFFGYAVSAVFLIIALARPQTSFQKIKRSVEGIDILLVLDLSASMRIEDFRQSNRIDVAKQVISEFIDGRTSDKIGLEVFSGEAVTLVPPTLDYTVLKQALRDVNIGDLKDGTAIGDAIATAVGRMKESTAKSKVILLVTDGDSNVGQVDPLTGGELAKGYGIKVYSVAIGREGRVAMPFIQKDLFGRQVKTYQYFDSSINPELLKQISSSTGAKFYRVEGDEKAFRDVFKEIDRLERRKVETNEQVKYEEHFMEYLKFGLVLLCLTFLMQQTVLRVYP